MRLARLWPFAVLAAIPFTGLPVAVQVGLAVGAVVLMMAQAIIARNPGTRSGVGGGDTTSDPAPWIMPPSADHAATHASHHEGTSDGHGASGDWGGDGGGDSGSDGGGGDGGGGGD